MKNWNFRKMLALVLAVLLVAAVPIQTFAQEGTVTEVTAADTASKTPEAEGAPAKTGDGTPSEPVQEPPASSVPVEEPPVTSAPVEDPSGPSEGNNLLPTPTDPDPSETPPETDSIVYTQDAITLSVGQSEEIDFGEGAEISLKDYSEDVVQARAENGKLIITALAAGTAAFKADVTTQDGTQYLAYTITVTPPSEEPPVVSEPVSTNNAASLEPQTITVTFRIDNPEYTEDTGSKNTHITVDAPYAEGQGLTYTKWVKTYKVTGTGVLQSYEIPAGTALTSWPKVNVTNIGDGNAVTYLSSYAWVDGQGSVCSPSAAFTQDTVLSLHLYQDNTILTQDTTFTAKFAQSQICSVTFRDVPPEGNEAAAVTVQVDSGRTLEQAIQASDQSAWADGTPLTQCKWYTLGQDGQKVPAELSDVVSGDMELYTYTYEVVLTLSPQQAAMALSMAEVQNHPDGTITAREGQQLAASDFVIDGVDYSVYTWQTNDGETVSIQNLIQNGLTENITATSTETANETGNIQFFIAKDGKWTVLAERNMTLYTVGERYALTAAQLESVYGAYGFRAGNLEVNKKLFGHTSRDNDKIWTNAPAVEQDGIVYVQILKRDDVNKGQECDVYYLPNSFLGNDNDGDPKESLAALESFYSVEIQDPGHKVYPEGQLPAATYTLNGGTATVRVKTVEDVTWQCVGKNGGNVAYTDNDDDTVTFTISDIDQPYVISPQLAKGEVQVTYNINLPQAPADETYGKPNIQGGEVYTHVAKAENYTLLAPSMTSYFYEDGKYLGEATFQGWAVNGNSEHLYLPGDSYPIPGGATQVTFTAQWEEDLGGTNSTMVSFFVALTAIPEGGTSWSSSVHTNFFTNSVFTTDCGVTGQDTIQEELYEFAAAVGSTTQYYVLGATSGANLNAIHNNIVTLLTNGYTAKGYTFRAEFPTDEVIMRQIRRMVGSGTRITLNGKTVLAEDLTAENFTVKWHVFKYDDGDGWHIDGVLVAKTGKLRITKTFAGDAEAIKALKNGYQIQYESVPFPGEGDLNPPHPDGTLTLTGDTSYNPATNTYTWEVDVDQYRDYRIREENYKPGDSQVTLTAQYQVQHSKFAGQNTTGWQPYQDSVTVTGQSQTDTALQTVSFLNTYTQVGTMTLCKVDALTNGLMANVSFTVAKENGTDFQLYSLGNGQYTVKPEGAELVVGNRVTTNANGLVFLDLGGTGTYTFTEVVPTGYEDPGVITVTLGDNGSINHAEAEYSSQNRRFTDFSGSELLVRNYSKVVPLRVEKIWADNENTSVTLQGLVGGQSMGSDYSVSLSNGKWSHRFIQKVPLYINGQKAVYSLLEENIGTWSYSPEYADDGYRYYDVSYSPMVYRNSQGQVVTNPDQAEEIYLSVTNQRSTGALTITKVDQDGAPLPGAEFYLYKASTNPGAPPVPKQDADGYNVLDEEFVKSVVSQKNGMVNFGNVPVGTYYLIEHAAPEFYQGTNTVYLVEVQEGSSTMKQCVNDAWAATTKIVTNTLQTMEVTIKKVVAGNFGVHTKDFAFTVTSDKAFGTGTDYRLSNSNKTASFTLQHNGSVTLKVQADATLTIAETNAQDYTMRLAADKGEVTENRYTVSQNGATITVTNTKNTEVDTGIALDSLPYILLLVLAVLFGIFFLAKHKRRRED